MQQLEPYGCGAPAYGSHHSSTLPPLHPPEAQSRRLCGETTTLLTEAAGLARHTRALKDTADEMAWQAQHPPWSSGV